MFGMKMLFPIDTLKYLNYLLKKIDRNVQNYVDDGLRYQIYITLSLIDSVNHMISRELDNMYIIEG